MYYELYIDVLFLVNFMMDYILLLITRKIIKSKISYGNICLGALVGSVLTCVVAAIPVPYTFIKFILFHAVINVVMIKIGLRIRWNRDFLRALITLYISGFLVGGVFSCLDQYVKTGSLFFCTGNCKLLYFFRCTCVSYVAFTFWKILLSGESICRRKDLHCQGTSGYREPP